MKNSRKFRGANVDWDSRLTQISKDLDVCIKELQKRRRGIMKLRENRFDFDYVESAEPTTEDLECIARELGGLEHGIGYVVRRFDQLRLKLLPNVAIDAIRERMQEEILVLQR